MSAYGRGSKFEHRVRKQLEHEGFAVIRAAGSRGRCDLVAGKPGVVLMVQCRINGRFSATEREELSKAAWYFGARAYLAARGPAGKLHYPILLTELPEWMGRAVRNPMQEWVEEHLSGPALDALNLWISTCRERNPNAEQAAMRTLVYALIEDAFFRTEIAAKHELPPGENRELGQILAGVKELGQLYGVR